jgi:spermidine/putrescine transport system substrate-binding protein
MPEDSPERALERLLFEGQIDRRRFLGRAGSSALMLSGLSTVLAACGGVAGEAEKNKSATTKAPAAVNHPKTAIDRLVFANWPLYMDKAVLKDFEKQYGGKVRYVEEINDNYEFFGKVRQQLTRGEAIDRDIVVLTSYMSARWVRNGYAEPIDKKNVPNAKNLVSNLRSVTYDKDRSYTLPYQSGAIGLGYNKKLVGRELKSISDLFDPKFKGRVTMLQEPYDSAGLVMLSQGVDPTNAGIDQILTAITKIKEEKDKGQIRRFTGNDYTTDLTKGNTWAAVVYSGDMVQLSADNPDLEFVYPEEGAMLFTDEMLMPKGVAHPYAAETMMNFLYEPEVAAKVAEYVNYISPVDGIAELAPDIADNPLIFPPDDVRQRLHNYPALSPSDERRMQEAMAQVTGA